MLYILFELVFRLTVSYQWTAAKRGCPIKFRCYGLFKCKKSHTSRCLNLLLSIATASLWFKWMDDTVSWGDLILSYFTMMLSHKSLRYCTLDDCKFLLDCCRLRNETRLLEQSSNQRIFDLRKPGFAYQLQHQALYPTCSLGPHLVSALKEPCYLFPLARKEGWQKPSRSLAPLN